MEVIGGWTSSEVAEVRGAQVNAGALPTEGTEWVVMSVAIAVA